MLYIYITGMNLKKIRKIPLMLNNHYPPEKQPLKSNYETF